MIDPRHNGNEIARLSVRLADSLLSTENDRAERSRLLRLRRSMLNRLQGPALPSLHPADHRARDTARA